MVDLLTVSVNTGSTIQASPNPVFVTFSTEAVLFSPSSRQVMLYQQSGVTNTFGHVNGYHCLPYLYLI